jgi:hypothetical protein
MPTGIAWDSEKEKLYVLDASNGLYVLDRQGKLLEKIALNVPDGRMLNDIVLTGTSIAAISDVAGYRVDLTTGALTPFFCLLPDPPPNNGTGGAGGMGIGGAGGMGTGGAGGGGGGSPMLCEYHRSGGLAYVNSVNRFVTAPQYFDCATNLPSRTDFQAYDADTGYRNWTITLSEPAFLGAMAWDPSHEKLFIGIDGQIRTLDNQGLIGESGLEGFAVGDIQGLSMDTGSKALWVLDATSNRIVHVNLP